MLGFRPGDWVIHKNVPQWGQCTAARLSSEYFYQEQLPASRGGGRYCFHVDRVFKFVRGDGRAHSIITSRLKNVKGALYQIRFDKEFYESFIALGYELDDIDKKRLAELDIDETKIDADHFKREVNYVLEDLTSVIQRSHPDKDLEHFLAEVFRKIPGVIEVKENGSGWKTDFGADLIVKSKKNLIVVQVKSFVGEVWNTACVDQIKTAIEKFDATYGIIITTGQSTPVLDTAVKKLADDMKKKNIKVRLVSGAGVAKFVLKYGLELII